MAEAFRLEVEGWGSASESSAPGDGPSSSKRRRLSLTRKRATCTTSTATERFEFLDDAKSEALTKKFVPKNTEKNTQWTLSTFLSWRDKRNQCFSEEPEKQVPLDILGSTDSVAIWFTFFVAEVRKKDGTEYPPKTLYLLLTFKKRRLP